MKNQALAMKRVLSADPGIITKVGFDADNSVKVYQTLARENTKVPYIIIGIIPSGPQSIQPVYGDAQVMQVWRYAVSCWARNSQEAWELAEIAHDATEAGDFIVEPYTFAHLRMLSVPAEHPDRDTPYRQVLITYELMVGR